MAKAQEQPTQPTISAQDIVNQVMSGLVPQLEAHQAQIVAAVKPAPPPPPPKPLPPLGSPDLLSRHLDYQQQCAKQKYNIVDVPEAAHPSLTTYETAEAWVTAIKALLGKGHYVFPFIGDYTPISAGPNRFLSTKLGALPLFDIPKPSELVEATHGWVGDEPLEGTWDETEAQRAQPPEVPPGMEVHSAVDDPGQETPLFPVDDPTIQPPA